MEEEKPKNAESETFIKGGEQPKDTESVLPVVPAEVPNGITQEKSPISVSSENPAVNKSFSGSVDREVGLAGLQEEKILALIKAWEESAKSRVENKKLKELSLIETWENSKKWSIESQLRKFEENLERKRAQYKEKMKNKAVDIHKAAEEKKAAVIAKHGQSSLMVEEMAVKHRANGFVPEKGLGCFGC